MGPTFSGVQLFQGGVQLRIPLETHITCDSPGSPDLLPAPPLDPLAISILYRHFHFEFWPVVLDDLCLVVISSPIIRSGGPFVLWRGTSCAFLAERIVGTFRMKLILYEEMLKLHTL